MHNSVMVHKGLLVQCSPDIDTPVCEHVQNTASPATSDFEQELADYLKALRLPATSAEKAQALCRHHDFSAAQVHLIISRPGYHSGMALGCCLVLGRPQAPGL